MSRPFGTSPNNPGYIATLIKMVHLVWRTSPVFFCSLFGLTLVTGLTPLAMTLLTSRLIDTIVAGLRASQVAEGWPAGFTILLVLLGVVGLTDQLLTRLRSAVERLYQTRVKNHVSLLIAEKAASLDLAFFENPAFHDQLRNASMEASFRPVLIITQLMSILSGLVTMLSMLLVVVVWQVWMVPVIVLSALATFGISLRYGSANVNLVVGRTPEARKAHYLGALLASDTAAKDVRLFGLRDFLLSQYSNLLTVMYRQDRHLLGRQTLLAALMETVLTVVRPFLVGFTAVQALRQFVSIGQFNLYTQAIFQLQTSVAHLLTTIAQLHENNLFVGNLFRFLALQPDVEAPRAHELPKATTPVTTPSVEFRHVCFRYPSADEAIIADLSFRLAPGEAVALVGENGAGKTTLVKLLTGLYRPTAGQILFDGTDIATIGRDDLRAFLSVLFQDYPIYHFSLYDNIATGCIEQIHDRSRVEAAANRSGLDHVIADLPDGYDTMLGRWFERGHELSGGQRQLVALTRALMRDAPILVLDEPTAALDIEAERHFFGRLLDEQRASHQSVLFVSHRFSTVRRADRILVLEHGTLIEQGSHEALMERRGRYAHLFGLQAELYRDARAQSAAEREAAAAALPGVA